MPYADAEMRRKSHKRHRERNQEKLLEYLSFNHCIDCGETDPIVLEFDHRDQIDKKFNVGKMVNGGHFSWEKIKTEIEKCDVRCANCHRRRTYFQFSHFGRGMISTPNVVGSTPSEDAITKP